MIIVSIVGPGIEEAVRQIRQVRGLADILELRLDLIGSRDSARLLRSAGHTPVIGTCRPIWEEGAFRGTEASRAEVLRRIADQGATYIDIESEALRVNERYFNQLRDLTKVISSHHVGLGKRIDVRSEIRRLMADGTEVVKFAYHTVDSFQCRYAFEFLRLARGLGVRAIAIGMGPAGEATRVLYRKFGGWATFASSGEGKESAPGQVSASDLKTVYRADRIGPRTRVYGLVGNPVAQSKGVYLHNMMFARSGADAVYCRFLTGDLPKFMRHVAPVLDGMSVTLPHKQRMVRYLEVKGPGVEETGAVNTVVRKDGRLIGYNADAPAALDAIERVCSVAGRSLLVIGSGGAARAVVAEARRRGAQVAVAGRTDDRARGLARIMGAGWVPWERIKRARGRMADIVVNTTPVGMAPRVDASPVPRAITTRIVAVDAIYNPPVTRFLKEARARGSRIVSGMEWFIAQAVWQSHAFGVARPDEALMRRVFTRRMRGT